MSKKPTVLMILDGFGLNETQEGNAVAQANTPVLDKLMSDYPFVKGYASGLAVGLPDGQMGNSEVGHLNMGAGRIVYQELTRISKEIEDGDFFKNEALLKAVENCKKNGSGLCQTAAYTATILIFTGCWSLQKDKGFKMYMYIALWTGVTQRLLQERALSRNWQTR